MRFLIVGLFALVGLACSEKASPIVGETFVWPPAAAVEGRVVSQSGAGIGNATITVTALRPRPIFSVGIPSVSDADGYFKLTVSSETGVDSASLQFATQRPGVGAAQIDTVLLRFGPTSLNIPSPAVNRFDLRWRGQ